MGWTSTVFQEEENQDGVNSFFASTYTPTYKTRSASSDKWSRILVVYLRGVFLLNLEHCCREQRSGSPKRGWSGFFVMWSVTNTGTRQTRNAGIQRKRLLNGSPTALRSSLVSKCASDSSTSCGFGLRPHNSYHRFQLCCASGTSCFSHCWPFFARSQFICSFGRFTERARLKEPRKMAWPQYNRRGFPKFAVHTHTFFWHTHTHTHVFALLHTHRFLQLCTTHTFSCTFG